MKRLYSNRLDELDRKFSSLSPSMAKKLSYEDLQGTSLHIVAGIPLLRNDFKNQFNRYVENLKKINPTCIFYSDQEIENFSHITIASIVRLDNSSIAMNSSDNKKSLIEIFSNLDFEKFTVRPLKFYPNGIVLWNTNNNGEEVFELRRKIKDLLLKSDLLYSKDAQGDPPSLDIIHSAFMKNIESVSRWNSVLNENFISKLAEINEDLSSSQIFKSGIEVDILKIISELSRVSSNTIEDFLTKQTISTERLIKAGNA